MIPHFTNTTAFWALLAIPLITAWRNWSEAP